MSAGTHEIKYKRNNLIFFVDVCLIIASLPIIIVMSWLSVVSKGQLTFFLLLNITANFWFFWLIAMLAVKPFLLEGNQWLKCSPILVLALAQLIIGTQSVYFPAFGYSLAVGSVLTYVSYNLTSWWKPYERIDLATKDYGPASSPMYVMQQPVQQTIGYSSPAPQIYVQQQQY